MKGVPLNVILSCSAQPTQRHVAAQGTRKVHTHVVLEAWQFRKKKHSTHPLWRPTSVCWVCFSLNLNNSTSYLKKKKERKEKTPDCCSSEGEETSLLEVTRLIWCSNSSSTYLSLQLRKILRETLELVFVPSTKVPYSCFPFLLFWGVNTEFTLEQGGPLCMCVKLCVRRNRTAHKPRRLHFYFGKFQKA